MDLTFDERPSNSPFIETIWRSQSERAGPFISMAEADNSLVITKRRGRTTITVRGPETMATVADSDAEAEFVGIRLKAGVYLPHLPPRTLMDRHDESLPEAGSGSFWLNGAVWQYPNYENVETFIERLVRDGALAWDAAVGAALQGRPVEMSLRTVERRFIHATGLPRGSLHQIQRARYATNLLKDGLPILDVVIQAGYFDQAHLTRALRRFIGLTPGQVTRSGQAPGLVVFIQDRAFPRCYPVDIAHVQAFASRPWTGQSTKHLRRKETIMQKVIARENRPSVAAPEMTRTLLTCGIIAGPLYVAVGLLQSVFRPGYDPRHDLSLLSNGSLGWIQIANFLVSGLLVVAAAVGMRRAIRGSRGGTWAPWLIGLYGLGLIGAGIFVADPMNGFPPGTPAGPPVNPTGHGFMHILSGALGFLGLIAACFVFARRFAELKQGRWTAFSIATGILFFAAFFGVAAGSQQGGTTLVFVTLAFTVAVLLAWAWLSLVAARLIHADISSGGR